MNFEQLLNGGSISELPFELSTWTSAAKRSLYRWIVERWKRTADRERGEARERQIALEGEIHAFGPPQFSELDRRYTQDAGAWQMRLVVAAITAAPSPERAFVINVPIEPGLVDRTTFHYGLKNITAAEKAAVVEAVVRRGPDFAAGYVAAILGKQKRPMHVEVVWALLQAFSLDPIRDDALSRAGGMLIFRLCDRRLRGNPPLCFTTELTWSGQRVQGNERRHPTLAAALNSQFAMGDILRELFMQPSGWPIAYLDRGQWEELGNALMLNARPAGILLRAELLGLVIAALTRPLRARIQEFYALVFATLAPSADELQEHAPTLIGILASAHGSCAQTVFDGLVAVDREAQLDDDDVDDVARIMAARKEKGLKRACLKWLGERSTSQLEYVAHLLRDPDLKIASEAVAVLVGIWERSSANARNAARPVLAEITSSLDPMLRERLPIELAVGAVASAPTHARKHAVGRPPAAHFIPLLAIDDSETMSILSAMRPELCRPADVYPLERLWHLAFTLASRGRRDEALTLLPNIATVPSWYYRFTPDNEAWDWLEAVEQKHALPTLTGMDALPLWAAQAVAPIVAIHLLRLREMTRALQQGIHYPLLACPSHQDGSIQPSVLADRIEQLAARGAEAAPLDLLQALLRTSAPALEDLARIRRIPHVAARSAHAFLSAGGMSQCQSSWRVGVPPATISDEPLWSPGRAELLVELTPVETAPVESGMPTRWADGLHYGTEEPAHARIGLALREYDLEPRFLAGVLPHNAEILACWHIWSFRRAGLDHDSQGGKGSVLRLPMLLDAGGQAGPAIHLALIHGLNANDASARLVAADAFVRLLQEGRFDAALACALIAQTCQCGNTKLSRLAAGLSHVHQAGWTESLWPVVAGIIESMLRQSSMPNGLANLLALASDMASRLESPGRIDGLTQLSARRDRSKLQLEARRLQSVLGG